MDFSIIIPHSNSLDTLKRLFDTIPFANNIEIILIDNSKTPISREEVGIERDYKLLHSSSSRFAGGARNVGLDMAVGKWLIFADADDFFTPEAFSVFNSYVDCESDLVYFKSTSVYDDTLVFSDRNVMFNEIVDNYSEGLIDEFQARISYLVPWGKMVRRSLVVENSIRFDEVLAANDVMFSTKVGFFSKSFAVDLSYVYCVTTRRASLAQRRDLPVIESRYYAFIRRNAFLKREGFSSRQSSVMVYIWESLKFGPIVFFSFLWTALKFRQNIFIGYNRWFTTARTLKLKEKRDKKYISR